MVGHLQPIKSFEREMTSEFIADFTRRFEPLYRNTYIECQDYMKPYQRYMRPHILLGKRRNGPPVNSGSS